MIRGLILTMAALLADTRWHAAELGHSAQSSWSEPQTLLVGDSATFRGAWDQLFPIPSMRPALPAVDFARYRVFVVAAGTRPTGGYRLALDEGHVVGDTALIAVNEVTPPAGCSVMQLITTPAVAIAVPNTPIGFRITTHVRPDSARCN